MKPTFFPTSAGFRRWLKQHHQSETELWVGFHKKGSGRPSLTYPEALDEALCFGWIDGVRKSVDEASYMQRFTPRKVNSNWSLVNIRRAEELIRDGRMHPAGLRAFEARDEKRSGYSFEQRESAQLSDEERARFQANRAAWTFFRSQPPGYRKTVIWWVVSAKREATRSSRLQTLINDSAAGLRIAQLRRAKR